MICPKCQHEIDDNATVCEFCSEVIKTETDTESTAQIEEAVTEAVAPDKTPSAVGKKKNKTVIAIAVTAAAVTVGILLFVLSHFGILDKVKNKLSGKTPVNGSAQSADGTVLSVGKIKISAQEYAVYYLSTYIDTSGTAKQYDDYLGEGAGLDYTGFDITKIPSAQKYSQYEIEGVEDPTWDDYFDDSAKQQIQIFRAFTDLAEKDGLILSNEQNEELDSVFEQIKSSAEKEGKTVEEYIVSNYGEGVTPELLRKIYEQHYLAQNYISSCKEDLVESITDDDVEQYAASKGSYNTDDNVKGVDVRHILVKFDAKNADDAQKAEYLAKAKEILAKFNENPTQENFADLAGQYSEDGGSSSNGGLYECVYPGKMVQEFNDWIFDSGRKPGDTGIIMTQFGYHIMYYIGNDNPVEWFSKAKEDMINEKLNEMCEEIIAKDEYKIEIVSDNLKKTREKLNKLIENKLNEAAK